MMLNGVKMTSAILDRRVGAYRCRDCKAAYQRAPDGLRAVNLATLETPLVVGADGCFGCPCGSTQRFGWLA